MSDDERKSGSDTYSIPKLNETNYRTWSQQLKWILDEKELLEIVEGKEKEPTPPTEGEVSEGTRSFVDYQNNLASFKKKVKKARSMIGATVSESVLVYLEGLSDPAE